jgi:hypothetical protein
MERLKREIDMGRESTLVLEGHVNRGVKSRDRYYLEEYFAQLPGINGDILSATEATNVPVNKNFEVLGTNGTSALATRSITRAAMTITTPAVDQEQMIVAPHLDSKQSAWSSVLWGTENQVEWECSVTTASNIADVKIWAGLKLTNDQLVATDADQAFFKFQTDVTNSETFADLTLLHFVHSIGNTDYISALPITVAASTNYHLKIKVDSGRQLAIFVNGVQYDVTSTAGSTGTAVAAGDDKSAALTDNIDLIPYVGIEAGTGTAKALDVHFVAINRILFE